MILYSLGIFLILSALLFSDTSLVKNKKTNKIGIVIWFDKSVLIVLAVGFILISAQAIIIIRDFILK